MIALHAEIFVIPKQNSCSVSSFSRLLKKLNIFDIHGGSK